MGVAGGISGRRVPEIVQCQAPIKRVVETPSGSLSGGYSGLDACNILGGCLLGIQRTGAVSLHAGAAAKACRCGMRKALSFEAIASPFASRTVCELANSGSGLVQTKTSRLRERFLHIHWRVAHLISIGASRSREETKIDAAEASAPIPSYQYSIRGYIEISSPAR